MFASMDTNSYERTFNSNNYDQNARRHREKLAFVEHICGAMIEDRFADVEEPPRPWHVFDGDIEGAFFPVSCFDLMPDAAFDLLPGEFAFMRYVSRNSDGSLDTTGRNAAVRERVSGADRSLRPKETRSFTLALLPEDMGRGSPVPERDRDNNPGSGRRPPPWVMRPKTISDPEGVERTVSDVAPLQGARKI